MLGVDLVMEGPVVPCLHWFSVCVVGAVRCGGGLLGYLLRCGMAFCGIIHE